MAFKREYNYFQSFVEQVEFASSGARMLLDTYENFDAQSLPQKLEEMHHIEHTADLRKHDMMKRLAKEFITPIEREDIMELAQKIDDVVDAIEDVLMRTYMFHIRAIRPDALEICKIIVKCCDELKKTMEEFENFRKSKTIHAHIIEVNRLEEEGDRMYTDAVHKLYVESSDPVEMMVWSEMFDYMEWCCDACEDASDVVESVIMKNT